MRRPPGAALLEVIVALAILGGAGVALLSVTGASHAAVSSALHADREIQQADEFLTAVTLWTPTQLDQRLGERPQGPFRLVIQRVDRNLYDVALLDSLGAHVLLETTLFRGDTLP